MRVAIDCRKITDFGIGTYIRGLITELAVLDTVNDYVAFIPSRARNMLPARFEPVIVNAPNYRLRELIVVGRAIARARADVFHAPHINVPLTSAPTVVTLHDVIPFHFLSRVRPEWWYTSIMTRRAAHKSVAVLTVSESSKREIVAMFGCPPEKVVVTPNGVDAIFFTAAAPATSRGRYLFYAGNDKPHKNVKRLVAAFDIVRRRHPGLRLVLSGASFQRYRGHPGVELSGFVGIGELAALYRGAEAVVLPSLEEGFGLPAVEAMAAGAPVVTSAIPAMIEVTADAALHVDPVSPEAIADGIERVITDGPLRESLRRRGPEQARKYSWRRCAELTRDVYQRVFEASSRRTRS